MELITHVCPFQELAHRALWFCFSDSSVETGRSKTRKGANLAVHDVMHPGGLDRLPVHNPNPAAAP
jgi:hypothetical protein